LAWWRRYGHGCDRGRDLASTIARTIASTIAAGVELARIGIGFGESQGRIAKSQA